ncbi:MAG: NlpC/P60 family protein [Woeseiaceae bacterium]|nr:NlpC/P60 family protein [Woeseiaceae bacterium]
MHISVDFWIDRTEHPDEVLADRSEISRLVRDAFRDDPNLVDLANYPDTLPGSTVAECIRSVSKQDTVDLYYHDGDLVSTADYARYEENLNLGGLTDTTVVRFGIVLRRADMRTWPTRDEVMRSRETADLDRFQENALFPADVVAILNESADGEWYFVQSHNYAAWAPRESIAIGDRDQIAEYRDAGDFLVVAGNAIATNFNPRVEALSELRLDMGVRLPLLQGDDLDLHVDGQNPASSYAVSLPVRGDGGELQFRTALIARNQDVSIGYMPFTRRNILHQAFKFLGERYGWGHAYNARDCSGLVMEVYKTFGIPLPRNTLQQQDSPIGDSVRFSPGASAETKLEALARADVGDLLYSPGHVMLYLGNVDGEPFVIHSLFGAGWIDTDGDFREGVLNGVAVTPLEKVYESADATYFDRLHSIKRIGRA